MDLKAGIGLPELLHAGLRFNISRAHYDISFGGWPEENQYSVSANYAHHFGKKWKEEWTKQPPWYMSWGGTYMYFRSDVAETHDVYLNGRLGRDFNLLRSLSLSLSLGVGMTLYHEKIQLAPSSYDFDIYLPVIPSGQFTIAYTFLKDISEKEN